MTIFRMTTAKNNAELIVMARDLGYIPDAHDTWTLDCTYGSGRFWNLWRPEHLIRSDANVVDEHGNTREGVIQTDFTNMPWGDDVYSAVVYDPPYKLNGTPAMGGPATSDVSYGVGKKQTIAERMELIFEGLLECIRVAKPGGYVLVKCQDQVSSGKVHWQTFDVKQAMDINFCDLVDMLHLPGYRKQPAGQQVHAHQNYSTLLIFQKPAR